MLRAAAFKKDHVSAGFTVKTAICFLALIGALLCIADNVLDGVPTAYAQDRLTVAASTDKSAPTSPRPKREAWMEASDYSVANPVVTYAVYGHAPNATNEQIVEHIRAQFANRGIRDVAAFKGRADMAGVAFYFFINGHQYGPVGIPNMMATIDEVAGHAKGVEYLREKGQPVP